MLLFPNAKINLGLNITEKRPDGFHTIETLFAPIELHDILEFLPNPKGTTNITITGIELDSNPKDNLVVKAWQLMHEAFDIPPVTIRLHKIIPVGAGLGGGSADAAFMLSGLNTFFRCGASVRQQEEMSAQIGSDCAFFIKNTSALGSGRGEILKPVDMDFNDYEILLVNPGIHIGTREAYAGITPQPPKVHIADIIKSPIPNWQGDLKNDFEDSIFPNHPIIAQLKEQMAGLGATYCAMSGSGSSVFGIFKKGELNELDFNFGEWFTYRGKIG